MVKVPHLVELSANRIYEMAISMAPFKHYLPD